jgi:hypothetical protein
MYAHALHHECKMICTLPVTTHFDIRTTTIILMRHTQNKHKAHHISPNKKNKKNHICIKTNDSIFTKCTHANRVYVYNNLYRLKESTVGVLSWSEVMSPNTPKPRSSHQAVASRTHLYITGGEFTSPSQMQFYHHRVCVYVCLRAFCERANLTRLADVDVP